MVGRLLSDNGIVRSSGLTLPPGSWGDTRIVLPAGLENLSLGDCLTDTPIRARGGSLLVADLLGRYPVALLATA